MKLESNSVLINAFNSHQQTLPRVTFNEACKHISQMLFISNQFNDKEYYTTCITLLKQQLLAEFTSNDAGSITALIETLMQLRNELASQRKQLINAINHDPAGNIIHKLAVFSRFITSVVSTILKFLQESTFIPTCEWCLLGFDNIAKGTALPHSPIRIGFLITSNDPAQVEIFNKTSTHIKSLFAVVGEALPKDITLSTTCDRNGLLIDDNVSVMSLTTHSSINIDNLDTCCLIGSIDNHILYDQFTRLTQQTQQNRKAEIITAMVSSLTSIETSSVREKTKTSFFKTIFNPLISLIQLLKYRHNLILQTNLDPSNVVECYFSIMQNILFRLAIIAQNHYQADFSDFNWEQAQPEQIFYNTKLWQLNLQQRLWITALTSSALLNITTITQASNLDINLLNRINAADVLTQAGYEFAKLDLHSINIAMCRSALLLINRDHEKYADIENYIADSQAVILRRHAVEILLEKAVVCLLNIDNNHFTQDLVILALRFKQFSAITNSKTCLAKQLQDLLKIDDFPALNDTRYSYYASTLLRVIILFYLLNPTSKQINHIIIQTQYSLIRHNEPYALINECSSWRLHCSKIEELQKQLETIMKLPINLKVAPTDNSKHSVLTRLPQIKPNKSEAVTIKLFQLDGVFSTTVKLDNLAIDLRYLLKQPTPQSTYTEVANSSHEYGWIFSDDINSILKQTLLYQLDALTLTNSIIKVPGLLTYKQKNTIQSKLILWNEHVEKTQTMNEIHSLNMIEAKAKELSVITYSKLFLQILLLDLGPTDSDIISQSDGIIRLSSFHLNSSSKPCNQLIYGFDHILAPIAPEVVHTFLQLNPYTLIESLKIYYNKLLSFYSQNGVKVNLSLQLPDNWLNDLVSRYLQLQQLLRQSHGFLTHLDILATFYPELATAITNARKQYAKAVDITKSADKNVPYAKKSTNTTEFLAQYSSINPKQADVELEQLQLTKHIKATLCHDQADYSATKLPNTLINRSFLIGVPSLIAAILTNNQLRIAELIAQRADLEVQDQLFCMTPLLWALRCNDAKTTKLLLDAKVNLKSIDKHHRGVGYFAAVFADIELLTHITQTQTIDLVCVDPITKFSALHLAVIVNNLEKISILATNTSLKESEDCENLTPLLLAAKLGNAAALCILIAAGSDTKKFDKTGNNLLHLICMSANIDDPVLFDTVIQAELPDTNSKNKLQQTPYDILKNRNDTEFLIGIYRNLLAKTTVMPKHIDTRTTELDFVTLNEPQLIAISQAVKTGSLKAAIMHANDLLINSSISSPFKARLHFLIAQAMREQFMHIQNRETAPNIILHYDMAAADVEFAQRANAEKNNFILRLRRFNRAEVAHKTIVILTKRYNIKNYGGEWDAAIAYALETNTKFSDDFSLSNSALNKIAHIISQIIAADFNARPHARYNELRNTCNNMVNRAIDEWSNEQTNQLQLINNNQLEEINTFDGLFLQIPISNQDRMQIFLDTAEHKFFEEFINYTALASGNVLPPEVRKMETAQGFLDSFLKPEVSQFGKAAIATFGEYTNLETQQFAKNVAAIIELVESFDALKTTIRFVTHQFFMRFQQQIEKLATNAVTTLAIHIINNIIAYLGTKSGKEGKITNKIARFIGHQVSKNFTFQFFGNNTNSESSKPLPETLYFGIFYDNSRSTPIKLDTNAGVTTADNSWTIDGLLFTGIEDPTNNDRYISNEENAEESIEKYGFRYGIPAEADSLKFSKVEKTNNCIIC